MSWGRVAGIPLSFALCSYGLWLLLRFGPEFEGRDALRFPRRFEDLHRLATLLAQYQTQEPLYVLSLFCSAYLYKQAFAIPGSALLNILGGALFGVWGGLVLVCVLSAAGASVCFLGSRTFAQPLLRRLAPGRLEKLRESVREQRGRLFFFLLSSRLFPMTPNWLLNVASPFVGVPLHLFFPSVFLGLAPYNFVCVEAGSILSQLDGLSAVLSWRVLGNLLVLAAVAAGLAFAAARNKNGSKRRRSRSVVKRL